jgi:hypothetical protein
MITTWVEHVSDIILSASNFSARYLLRKLYFDDTGIHGWEMSKWILRACVDIKGEPATCGSRQGQYGANVNMVMNLLFSWKGKEIYMFDREWLLKNDYNSWS